MSNAVTTYTREPMTLEQLEALNRSKINWTADERSLLDTALFHARTRVEDSERLDWQQAQCDAFAEPGYPRSWIVARDGSADHFSPISDTPVNRNLRDAIDTARGVRTQSGDEGSARSGRADASVPQPDTDRG